jgi:hypothetical protein
MRPRGGSPSAKLSSAAVAAVLVALLACAPAPSLCASAAHAAAATEAGPRWSDLTPAQRTALAPLERDWSTIDADRKQKWIQVSGRMPAMPAAERARVQDRMKEWARLSPQQRGQARFAYEQAKQASPKDRQERWEAYQALPAEQKRQLQARAVPLPAPVASRPGTGHRADKVQAKSNIVPNPSFAAPPKPVAPTVVQVQPGATTTLISRRAAPPVHQQTGLPKIAGTPEFVDKATLLPQRGPQAAATRSAAASTPEPRP